MSGTAAGVGNTQNTGKHSPGGTICIRPNYMNDKCAILGYDCAFHDRSIKFGTLLNLLERNHFKRHHNIDINNNKKYSN